MTELILLNRRDRLVEIALNRPEKRNALNWPMLAELDAALDEAERMDGARVILLRGEGADFSAGIDLTGFQELAAQFGEKWRENLFPLTRAHQAIANKIERHSLPVIALLHGFCLGLGLELALACDFRLAAEGTRLGLPESRLGLIPDVGGTTRLARLAGPARAKELILTGRAIDAQTAAGWGIVNSCAAAEQLVAEGEALAAEICRAAPLAVSYGKRIINELNDAERGFQLEAWAQSVLMRTEDFETGAQAMLARQPAEWKGR